ncbi:MAG: YggT family protein [Anaerolineales bacterium]|jgi:YggT family protein
MIFIAFLIHRIIQLLIIVVIIQTILTYFLSPFHPIRQFVDRIVEPMLMPIRRVLPPLGMLDFSPLVLIILLEVLDSVLQRILFSL